MSSKPWKETKVAYGPGSTSRDAGNLVKLIFGLASPIMEANGLVLDEIFEIDAENENQISDMGLPVSTRGLLGVYMAHRLTGKKSLGILLKDHAAKDFGNGHYWRHFADLIVVALHELTHAYCDQIKQDHELGHGDKFYEILFSFQHQYYECYSKIHDKLSTFVPDEATVMEIYKTKQTNEVTDILGIPYIDGRPKVHPQDLLCEIRQWAIELKLDSEIAEESGEKIEYYKGSGIDEPPVKGRNDGSLVGSGGGGGGGGGGMPPTGGMPPIIGGMPPYGGGVMPGGMPPFGIGMPPYGGGGDGKNPHCPQHGSDSHCPHHGYGNAQMPHGYGNPYGGAGGGHCDQYGNCGGGCDGGSCDNGYGGGYNSFNFNGDLSTFLNGLIISNGYSSYPSTSYACAIPGTKGKGKSKKNPSSTNALVMRTKNKPPSLGDVFRSIAKGFLGENNNSKSKKKICAAKFTDDKGYMGMKSHPKHKKYVQELVEEVVKTKISRGAGMGMSNHCCAMTSKVTKERKSGSMKNMVIVKEDGVGYKNETSQWEKDEVKKAVKAACAVKIGKSTSLERSMKHKLAEPSLFSLLFGSSSKSKPKMIMDKPPPEQKQTSHSIHERAFKSGGASSSHDNSKEKSVKFGSTHAKPFATKSNTSKSSPQRFESSMGGIVPPSDNELQAVLERSRNEAREKEEDDLRKALKESSKYR